MKKKLFLLAFLVFLFAYSISSQNFIEVTMSNTRQTIHLNSNQILEIKLPATPSTGYNWYITNMDKGVITQIGTDEFVPDPNSRMIGQHGTRIIRFAGVSQGTSELTLEYKQIWLKDKASHDVFQITLVSDGKYQGNYTPPLKSKFVSKHTPSSTPKSVPSSFSWQSECSPIKYQGTCGSCWAFAAVGAFEANINIIDHVVKNLSEQWMVNCSTHGDCSGGWCPFGDWMSPGAVYEIDEPYQSVDGTCQPSYPYHEQIDLFGSAYSDADIKQAIYDYGPVWSCVYASGYGFSGYSGGISMYDDGGGVVDHAIVLVGWKDTLLSNGSSGYWILRNSWGSGWGENGYMRIAYGVNLVGSNTSYLVYKGGIPHNSVLTSDFSATPLSGDAPLNVQFNDNSTTPTGTTMTTWLWNFGDGSTSNIQTPSHSYLNPGTYSVSLTVTNSVSATNSLTKSGYITVYAPGTTFIMSNSTISTCAGQFFDPGGSSGQYQNLENKTMTFLPDIAGNKLQMVFSTFDVEAEPNCGYDYLQIFDGNSISAPLIGKYCGVNSPGTVTATNADGALTYVFHSDEAAIGQGWSASISCISSNPVLTVTTTAATAITETTATIGGNVTTDGGYPVTSRGVCGGLTANPTILDFHTSDGTGTGIFTSNVTGLTPNTTYHIRAYAINTIDTAYGSDLTFTTQPTNSPVADFTGSPTIIIEGESVVFTNQSTGTITSYSWSFPGGTPSTATGVGPHTIVYNTAGVYDAILTVGTPANTMTKTNYITINAPGIGYIMSNSTVTTCSGIFYDSGGFGNLYQNYEDLTMTFLPDIAGNKLQMVFSTFDVEAEPNCGYDYLQIFDGNSISAPLIGKYCGTISPGTVSATNADGALTYVFHSDELVTGSGWDAIINCISPNPGLNDDCANAVTLAQTATCNPTNGTTVDATQSISPITCTGYTANSANDVWYKFVATSATPDITVTGSSSFDAVVDLRSGICNGTNINCADAVGTGGIETINASGLLIGSTYFIRVYSYATAGAFTICVNDGTVGITQNSTNSEVLIFPNPTNGVINIMNAEKNVICIYNATGELIYKNSATQMLTQVDMSQFSTGYYLIQVISKDQSIMKKISLIK
ncbi:MAG TPA: hypothetical protein DEH02_07380 [Bacteroidales bacterium]|nr:hypothetical protein [Bacteroidales bacterium]